MNRRLITDLLLVFSSAFVITLAVWPQSDERQIVRIQDVDGQWLTRSMDVSDPRLQEIEYSIAAAEKRREAHDALEAWSSELDEFYRQHPTEIVASEQTDQDHAVRNGLEGSSPDADVIEQATMMTLTDDVAVASFDQREADQVQNMAAQVETAGFQMEEVSEHELASVPTADSETNASEKPLSVAPSVTPSGAVVGLPAPSSADSLQIADRFRPGKSAFAFQFAFLVGIIFACIYKHLLLWSPPVFDQRIAQTIDRVKRYSMASSVALALFASLVLLVF